MTTTTHKRSTHIDAPVEKVFDYVKDPQHFLGAFPESVRGNDTVMDFSMTTEGVGSTYQWRTGIPIFHVDGVVTREEYIPNERIVDRASTRQLSALAFGLWTSTFEPDRTGTTLTVAFEYSSKVPLMDKVVDRLSWHGDEDLDKALASLKKSIEI